MAGIPCIGFWLKYFEILMHHVIQPPWRIQKTSPIESCRSQAKRLPRTCKPDGDCGLKHINKRRNTVLVIQTNRCKCTVHIVPVMRRSSSLIYWSTPAVYSASIVLTFATLSFNVLHWNKLYYCNVLLVLQLHQGRGLSNTTDNNNMCVQNI